MCILVFIVTALLYTHLSAAGVPGISEEALDDFSAVITFL